MKSPSPLQVFLSLFLFFNPTSVISTVLASISCRARTDRDCTRMKVHMAKSGGTFYKCTGTAEFIKTRLHTPQVKQREEWHQHLTWALDVVSRKQRRFPKPSQDRHSLICSFRTEAVHCRTTWSSCTQNTIKHLGTHLLTVFHSGTRYLTLLQQIWNHTSSPCTSALPPFHILACILCFHSSTSVKLAWFDIWCRHCCVQYWDFFFFLHTAYSRK